MEVNLSDEFKCPICFEVPQREIFQCNNGHTICSVCCKNLSACPQCRVKYEAKKIRNRALESLLDSMRFDCPHKSEGCLAQVSRQEYLSHSESCEFAGNFIEFCKHLGYSCGFKVNSKNITQAVKHLTENHDFLLRQGISLEIRLEDFESISVTKSSYWTPMVLAFGNLQQAVILLSLYIPNDKSVSFTCFYISSESGSFKSSMRFIIKPINNSENPELEWTAKPLDIKFCQDALHCPHFRIPRDLLIQKFVKDGTLQIHCGIVNGDADDTNSQISEVVHIFHSAFNLFNANPTLTSSSRLSTKSPSETRPPSQFSPSAPPMTSGQPQFQTQLPISPVTTRILETSAFEDPLERLLCSNCGTAIKPLTTPNYKCLQCPFYDLCQKCMADNKHSHHIFAVIKNQSQEDRLRQKLGASLEWKAMFPPELPVRFKGFTGRVKTWCLTCRQVFFYVCLECRPVVGYCRSCFKGSHTEEHVFTVAIDNIKQARLIRNMPKHY